MPTKNNIVAAIYFHPEVYPPTLNAVNELSKIFSNIYLIYRPHLITSWQFPQNVKFIASGRMLNIKDQEAAPTIKKVFWFLQFTFQLYKTIKSQKPRYVLLYDPIPLFAFWIIRAFCTKDLKVWYHNHDIAEISKVRKYSISWFAIKIKSRIFTYIDIFTLPSEERKQYFPMDKLKGRYFFLPNYPAINFYKKFTHESTIFENQTIKLIYQGNVSKGHGLELIAGLLGNTIRGHSLELHIAGNTSEEMKQNLKAIASNYKDKITFHGNLNYSVLPYLTANCHIGLAILEPENISFISAGSASNKIYEYAACGLPILYFDDEHYEKYLGEYSWAFGIKLTSSSIMEAVVEILGNYAFYSMSSKSAFEMDLNFENKFEQLKQLFEK